MTNHSSPLAPAARAPRARARRRLVVLGLAAIAGATASALAACEDRTGGDILTRPGVYDGAVDDGGDEQGDGPIVTPRDAGDAGDAGSSCPVGSTRRHERTACADAAAPLVPPAAFTSDLTTALPGDVVSLAGMNESDAPCLPVIVCTPNDAPTMLFSDSPESPAQDGVLYADTVAAGRYRLYVYHTNGGATLRKFPIVVLNPGAAPAKVTIVRRGLAAPSAAYVSVGKTVTLDWLAARASVDVTVPAGQRVVLDPALDALHAAQDELVHAIYDVTVDSPVKISFVSVLAGADTAAVTAGLPLLPRDVDHQRGTFPKADVLVTLAPIAGGAQKSGVQRLRLGLDEVDETLEGIDAPTGVKQRLLGNYGMFYRFALALPSPASALVAPRGGPWGGVARVTSSADGGVTDVLLPTAAATLDTTTDAVFIGRTAGTRETSLVSAGGSNLPVDVFFVTP